MYFVCLRERSFYHREISENNFSLKYALCCCDVRFNKESEVSHNYCNNRQALQILKI